jgi:phage terminase small subunit
VDELTDIEQRFVLEYLKDFKGASAARRAGVPYKNARYWACRRLAEPRIAAVVADLKAKHLQRLDMEVGEMVDRLARIVNTDMGELVEYRRACCHHCWGKDHLYQRTDGALRAARVRHEQALKKARAEGRDLVEDIPEEFDEEGGGGFNATADPHPECPECHGEGIGVPFYKDTRDLGPNAAAAFAGVKMTKDGVEIKTHDAVKAIELLGKFKGAFTENVNVKGHLTVQGLSNRMRNRRPLA